MRTTLDIDEGLLKEAMRRAGSRTKTETVEKGLQELINAERRLQLRRSESKGYGMSAASFLRSRRDE